MDGLPFELLCMISREFSGKDLLACCHVSQTWRTIFSNELFWKSISEKCNYHNTGLPCDFIPCLTTNMPISKSMFNFLYLCFLKQRWKHGTYSISMRGTRRSSEIYYVATTSDYLYVGYHSGEIEVRSLHYNLQVRRCYHTRKPLHSIKCSADCLIINYKTSLSVFKLEEEELMKEPQSRIHKSNYHPGYIYNELDLLYEVDVGDRKNCVVSFSVKKEMLAISEGERDIQVFQLNPWKCKHTITLPDWIKRSVKLELTDNRLYVICTKSISGPETSLLGYTITGEKLFETILLTRWPSYHKIYACKPNGAPLISSHYPVSKFMALNPNTGVLQWVRSRTLGWTHNVDQQLIVTYELHYNGRLCVYNMSGEALLSEEHHKLCTGLYSSRNYVISSTKDEVNIWKLSSEELKLLYSSQQKEMFNFYIDDKFIITTTMKRPAKILFIDFR